MSDDKTANFVDSLISSRQLSVSSQLPDEGQWREIIGGGSGDGGTVLSAEFRVLRQKQNWQQRRQIQHAKCCS